MFAQERMMDLQKEREAFEKLKYIEEKLEYLNFDEHLDCYVEKSNGMPVGLAAWVNGAFYGFEQAAKAQAVPEKTVKLHLVWNENKDECVGFLDSKDARYTATGDDRGMFGVTALGDYFRDLNDECNEFETQIVMIEAQEQKG